MHMQGEGQGHAGLTCYVSRGKLTISGRHVDGSVGIRVRLKKKDEGIQSVEVHGAM